jgi:hypothetical protein
MLPTTTLRIYAGKTETCDFGSSPDSCNSTKLPPVSKPLAEMTSKAPQNLLPYAPFNVNIGDMLLRDGQIVA